MARLLRRQVANSRKHEVVKRAPNFLGVTKAPRAVDVRKCVGCKHVVHVAHVLVDTHHMEKRLSDLRCSIIVIPCRQCAITVVKTLRHVAERAQPLWCLFRQVLAPLNGKRVEHALRTVVTVSGMRTHQCVQVRAVGNDMLLHGVELVEHRASVACNTLRFLH